MDKERIMNLIVGSAIMLIVPIVAFFLINKIISLEPIIYVITAFSCFYTIIISMTLEVMARDRSWKNFGYSIIIMLVFPLVAFFTFDFLTPFPLTPEIFAGAGFGATFGAAAGVGFKLMLPRPVVAAQSNTCFARGRDADNNRTSYCDVFRRECQYLENANDCILYLSDAVGIPHRVESYLPVANMLAHARAIKTQNKFNIYILILSTVAIVIAVLSLKFI